MQDTKPIVTSRFAPPGERYASLLPVQDTAILSTLGEGNTPLIRSGYFSRELNIPELYFKLENTNPTGSFKDRIMACEVSLMRQRGCRVCLGPSTGNAGAALAAYAARFGIRCYIFATENADAGKLQQMLFHGARVQRIQGFGVSSQHTEDVFAALKQVADRSGAHLVCSAFQYNALGMEAVKTISFEICEQLQDTPNSVFLPIAGGGLLSATWKGFQTFHHLGKIHRLPSMNGVQSAGCPTVTRAVQEGGRAPSPQPSMTSIGALAAPFAPDGQLAVQSIVESGGWGYDPTDDEIYSAQRMLARNEGIYAEPIGAASVAGLIQAQRQKSIDPEDRIVCVITGHGFKDPESVARANQNVVISSVDIDQLLQQRFLPD
jgi:threonine synthase